MKLTLVASSAFAIFIMALCAMPALGGDKFQVTVSISPQKYFVEKIGGQLLDASVMVEPGVDPHVYDPRPQQMVALAKSKIYFAIGAPFEKAWLDRFSAANPTLSIVHTESGIKEIPMSEEHHHDSGKGQARSQEKAAHEDHLHGPMDPHIWLSPPLVMLQARNILNALLDLDPAHASVYEANYKRFILELVELDLELRKLLSTNDGSNEFMVFHPAWGYFAAAYGLVQIPIEIEGKEPKASDLKQLIEYAQKNRIRAIFVQPQFSNTSAKIIANAIGAQVVIADPMAQDWANNLREVGRKIKTGGNK